MWLYGVQRTRRDGSSFMWHQPCQRCKCTTLVVHLKCYEKIVTRNSCRITCECSESARGRRIVLYQSDQQQPLCFASVNVTSVVGWVLGLSHHRLLHKAATTANQLTNTHTHTYKRVCVLCFLYTVHISLLEGRIGPSVCK